MTSGAPIQSAQRRPCFAGIGSGFAGALTGRSIGELRSARFAPVRSSERSNSIAFGVAAGVLSCCVAIGIGLGGERSGGGGGTTAGGFTAAGSAFGDDPDGGTEAGLTTTDGASCDAYFCGGS